MGACIGRDPGSLPASRQGLFIIGCARSGTTVLQNALNGSNEVFLFGECDFHTDPATPDFAKRYNAMHLAWRNQPTKSTFCPALFEGDAPWREYISKLSETYKFVGAKIVLNPSRFLHDPELISQFYSREFYNSHFVFTFRDPLQMSQSTQELQAMTGGDVACFEMLAASYVAAVSLFLFMLRNLPNVHVVFHGENPRRVFSRLERSLNIRLPHAHRYYSRSKVRSYDPAPLLQAYGKTARLVLDLHRDFRRAAIRGFDLVQLEQNNANVSPGHLTPVGHLARRCEAISERLTFGRVVGRR